MSAFADVLGTAAAKRYEIRRVSKRAGQDHLYTLDLSPEEIILR